MAGTINYSVIIPHKNIPQLLVRCLASIPRRPDVQIIVVDDASDPSVVDFAHFPGLDDPQVEVVFTKKGRGAGYARNVGLERAVGKWVVFADADDYYLDNLSAMMDRYVDADTNMVVFKHVKCEEDGRRMPLRYGDILPFTYYFVHGDPALLQYYYFVPFGRFIRRRAIGGLRFQEVPYANDVFFFLRFQTGDTQMYVVNEAVYAYVRRENSLLTTVHWKNPYTRCRVTLDCVRYLKDVSDVNLNRFKGNDWPLYWWARTFAQNKWAALRLVPGIWRVTGRNLLPVFFRAVWGGLRGGVRKPGYGRTTTRKITAQ
ncbi:MAG: glycosyltransferase family 2 protein [Alloprevotella sp.]|nr:glycosyltransferase family 2 protein [Alloprevotella sp.]